MVNFPLDKSDFKEMSLVNYDTSSLYLTNPFQGDDNYDGPFINNVLIDSFKWLPNFPLQCSTSTSSGLGSMQEGNLIKLLTYLSIKNSGKMQWLNLR